MTEEYLHLIWKTKRLPTQQFIATNQSIVEIRNFGEYNESYSGPDFFNAQVKIDGILFFGNIEIHLKSSDWFKHNHHNDPAYRNVILHVVLEMDAVVSVEDTELTTIELKEFIDVDHLNYFENHFVKQSGLFCEKSISRVPQPVIWSQVGISFYSRIFRKSYFYSTLKEQVQSDLVRMWLIGVARSFGFKTNDLPFIQLALSIPLIQMQRCDEKNWEALCFGIAGFLDDEQSPQSEKYRNWWKYYKSFWNLSSMQKHSWKFKGCRPNGFPTLRIAQFAHFLTNVNLYLEWWELEPMEIKNYFQTVLSQPIRDFWHTHYSFDKLKKSPSNGGVSAGSIDTLLSNSIVIFLFWLGTYWKRQDLIDKSFFLSESLRPDKNIKLNTFEKLNIKPKSASESQGLLEMINELCSNRGCLRCKIGNEILRK